MEFPSDHPRFARAVTSILVWAVCLLPAGIADADITRWEVVRQEDGIVTESWRPEGRTLPIFRGSAVVEANIYQLLAILQDIDHHCLWMHGCHTARLVGREGDFSYVLYNRANAPWPVSDRDVVMRALIEIKPKSHTVLIRFTNITHPGAPSVEGVVRMPRLAGFYKLTALSESRTRVTYQVDADPAGDLPAWVAEMVVEDMPFNTLSNLRKRARKTKGDYTSFIEKWDPKRNPKAPQVVPE
jgi:hypothetical protein